MCVLTITPNSDHYLLTSNRDEHISRAASQAGITQYKDKKVLMASDPKAGGSWLAAHENGMVHCLLNGAFERHKHRPPYRLSRGIVLLDAFAYSSLEAFAQEYEFEGIEPFCLVRLNVPQKQLEEVRWDEIQAHFKSLDINEQHIWSSASLYDQDEKETRAKRYEFLDLDADEAAHLQFHKEERFELSAKLRDSIPGLKTLSISQLKVKSDSLVLDHYDMVEEQSMKFEDFVFAL